ncbi:EAL domain-containing protein [Sulfurovum mangrovi]|uniref:EAL domain-containing protein n=1 Tax=Sulfurovum mangrovi TaxID=2893889 RepID=UPI001E487D5B|nr:EAL domain-containing protein [Sulfurovum mangrovi]UFH60382.1 EAL domain-containing protein [Sulfurovum mangrovi]
MKNINLFIVLSLLVLGMLGYKVYEYDRQMKLTQKTILQTEIRTLAEFIDAFRITYQDILEQGHIDINETTLELLPVKSLSSISRSFSEKVKEEISIRSVSDQPRNPQGMANPFELEMIRYFREHPEKNEIFVKREDAYHYVKPLKIRQSCIKCHGEKEEVLPVIREHYQTGFGYKVGDVRGVLNIQIKDRGYFILMYEDFQDMLAGSIVVYLIFLLIIGILVARMRDDNEAYADRLREEIQSKTRKLAKQKDIFETLYEKSSDGIVILEKGKLVRCNQKIVDMLAYDSKEEVLNLHPSKLSPPCQPDGRDSYKKAEEMVEIARHSKMYQFEWVFRKSTGEDFFAEVTMTPMELDDRKVIYVIWKDITEKKKTQEKLLEQKDVLEYQANHDPLTDLPNRQYFNHRLQQEIDDTRKSDKQLALFFIDLDNFKQINDSLGHHVGDRVLVVVSERLKATIRKRDTLARLGGDEFTIIMKDITKMGDAAVLAKHIQETLTQPLQIEDHSLYISCSIGISFYPQDSDRANDLISYADAAMYKAKEEGRSNYQFYSYELTELAMERVVLQSNLREALKHHEFSLLYLPQVNAATMEYVGIEALIRWNHREIGVVSADRFIPIAEESGLIIEIDQWVMKTAMEQTARWYREGLNPGILSLNLSLRLLRSEHFMEILKKCMKESGFRPEWLELEVTESQLMRKPEEFISRLHELSEMGIEIAMDDFGTGYSSLAYLKRLPVNKIKIDNSFIKNIPEDKEGMAIVEAMLALAKTLNIDTIAEGVETEEELAFLREHHCTYVQGYYIGKPMSAGEIEGKLSGEG